jgi:hypothetical protein
VKKYLQTARSRWKQGQERDAVTTTESLPSTNRQGSSSCNAQLAQYSAEYSQ